MRRGTETIEKPGWVFGEGSSCSEEAQRCSCLARGLRPSQEKLRRRVGRLGQARAREERIWTISGRGAPERGFTKGEPWPPGV